MGDVLGGGKQDSGDTTGSASYTSDAATAMAQALWNATGGVRNTFLNQATAFMPTGDLPEAYNPVYAAGKQGIEGAYLTGRNNLLESAAPGGAVTQGFTELNKTRMGDLGSLQGNLAQDLYNKIYGAAFTSPQTSISGLANVAGSLNNLAGTQYQTNVNAFGKTMGGLGQGLGFLLGK